MIIKHKYARNARETDLVMATSTPWGPSQYSKQITRGIVLYGTAGHGGIHVSPTMLAKMPEPLRAIGGNYCGPGNEGWFEEDCAWCAVALAFPERFEHRDLDCAKRTLKNYYPEAYAKLYETETSETV